MYLPTLMNIKAVDPGRIGIPKTTIEDSRLTLLFSENVTQRLMYPCDSVDIMARQTIFADFSDENGEFFAGMMSLKSALVSLDSCEGGRRLATTKIVKLFKTVKTLRAFLTAIEKINALSSDSGIIRSVRSFWQIEKKDFVEVLSADTVLCESTVTSIGRYLLEVDRSGYVLSNDPEEYDYVDKLREAARELSIDLQNFSPMTLQPDIAFSQAVEKIYPGEIKLLEDIAEKYADLPVRELFAIKREIDFYLEIHNFVKKCSNAGISSVLPCVNGSRRLYFHSAYDISLLYKNSEHIVPNDISFDEEMPFCFLTGANGGGKTTYLRTVAVNLIFAVCGCPVYAKSADICPLDRIITHFPEDERFGETGRLLEEQKRIEEMLDESTSDSFLLFNEAFSGTDEVKGCRMTLETAAKISEKKAKGLFVTHFHEVASAGYLILTTTVDAEDNNRRTFRITLKKDGIDSSYAADILKKYNLDEDYLEEKIAGMSKKSGKDG